MEKVETQPKSSLMRHLPLAAIVIAAIIGYFTLSDYLSFDALAQNRESLLAFRDSNFALMALIFVAIYIVVVAFSLPGAAVLSLSGGFLFGLVMGTSLNVLGAATGAVLIFLAARLGLGQALSAKIDGSEGSMKKFTDGLREHEISVLLLMRLVPAVPFFVANLLPALVGVKLFNFAWTTVVGIIPGAIVFTWIGVGLGEVFDRGESPDLSLFWEPHIIGPIVGLCVLAALPILIKTIRGKKDA
ncbi:MAG: TVP38/TMEM64 family protein [Pseudomonadota bacterium]